MKNILKFRGEEYLEFPRNEEGLEVAEVSREAAAECSQRRKPWDNVSPRLSDLLRMHYADIGCPTLRGFRSVGIPAASVGRFFLNRNSALQLMLGLVRKAEIRLRLKFVVPMFRKPLSMGQPISEEGQKSSKMGQPPAPKSGQSPRHSP